MLTPKPNTNP